MAVMVHYKLTRESLAHSHTHTNPPSTELCNAPFVQKATVRNENSDKMVSRTQRLPQLLGETESKLDKDKGQLDLFISCQKCDTVSVLDVYPGNSWLFFISAGYWCNTVFQLSAWPNLPYGL